MLYFYLVRFIDPGALGSWELAAVRGNWTGNANLCAGEFIFVLTKTVLTRLLYSTRGPQRGGAESASSKRLTPWAPLLSSVNAYEPRPTCHHLPTPSHWGHWGGSPRDTLQWAFPYPLRLPESPSAGTIKKNPNLSQSLLRTLTPISLGVWRHVCARVRLRGAAGACDHIPARLPVPHVSHLAQEEMAASRHARPALRLSPPESQTAPGSGEGHDILPDLKQRESAGSARRWRMRVATACRAFMWRPSGGQTKLRETCWQPQAWSAQCVVIWVRQRLKNKSTASLHVDHRFHPSH